LVWGSGICHHCTTSLLAKAFRPIPDWFYQGDNLIQPASMLGDFVLESSYLPGLTTAWFSAGRLVEFDQSWPKEIFQQLYLLEDRRWREASVITVGPMFPPETPKEAIAEDFRQVCFAKNLTASQPLDSSYR
jgi:hypothetical protein